MNASIKFETGKTYIGQWGDSITISRRTDKSVWDASGNRYKIHPYTRVSETDDRTVEVIESTTGKHTTRISAMKGA